MVEILRTKREPCAQCPWRESNWGRTDTPHPEFNTVERREAMWSHHDDRPDDTGVRHGTVMLCHQGTPECYGGCNVSDTGKVRPCAGALALVHRQVLRFYDLGCNWESYKSENPRGLTWLTLEEAIRDLSSELRYAWRRSGMGVERMMRVLEAMPRDRLIALLHPMAVDPALQYGLIWGSPVNALEVTC